MKPDRLMRARVAILHGIMSTPGITLADIATNHGDHLEFMRGCLDDLTRMKLIQLESKLPRGQLKQIQGSPRLITEHTAQMKKLKRYDLSIACERIIQDHEHLLDEG